MYDRILRISIHIAFYVQYEDFIQWTRRYPTLNMFHKQLWTLLYSDIALVWAQVWKYTDYASKGWEIQLDPVISEGGVPNILTTSADLY